MLTHIGDHAAQAVARLASQYKGKPLIEGLLAAFTAQVQALEDALYQLATNRYLDTAEGVQLDTLGKVLVLPRGAAGDPEYRQMLAAKIRVVHSSGTHEELLSVFVCVQPTAQLTITDDPPACFTLEIDNTITDAEAQLYVSFLRSAEAAGVRGILLYREARPDHLLIFSDDGDYPERDVATGLADEYSAYGGEFSGARD